MVPERHRITCILLHAVIHEETVQADNGAVLINRLLTADNIVLLTVNDAVTGRIADFTSLAENIFLVFLIGQRICMPADILIRLTKERKDCPFKSGFLIRIPTEIKPATVIRSMRRILTLSMRHGKLLFFPKRRECK